MVGRGLVYAIMICLMIWVQMASKFYFDLIRGDNWFFCAIGIGLYI